MRCSARKKRVQFLPHLLKHLFFYSLFILCVLFGFSQLHARVPLKVEVSAKAAILINSETGAILFEKNAYQPLYPASITKISTAMYALEKQGPNLEEPVMASADAVAAVHAHVRRADDGKHPSYRLEFGGSHMGIKLGEVLSFRVLLYGLMLSSGNDAANVIAEHISGSVCQFLKELNAYVQSKGCKHTVFHTPHGLPHADHKTTAFDMAILAKEGMKNPLFREVVKTVAYKRPATNLQPESILHQHNALVKPGSKFYYPKAIGIKTGYTSAGGYTLVAAAEDKQRKLIAVLLGCEHLDQRYRDAITLFETAFQEKKAERTLFSEEFDFFSTQVSGGKNGLQAGLGSDLIVAYYPSEGQIFHSKIFWDDQRLPIRKGEKVGEIAIYTDNEQLFTKAALYATNGVDPTLRYVLGLKCQAGKQMLYAHHSIVLSLIGCITLAGAFIFHAKIRKKMKQG